MPYGELDFSESKLSLDWREVNQMFGADFGEGSRRLLERTLNVAIAEEFKSSVGARPYERVAGGRVWRNGYRRRSLLTRLGRLELVIPRLRQENFQPSWLERFRRLEASVADGLKTMFIRGVSTEGCGDVLQVLCGERVSKSTVSQLAVSLNEQVQAYLQRPIDDQFIFLFLDGITVKIRGELSAEKWSLLVAYGIRADGRRELIGFQKSASESQACWERFLNHLKMRGLHGERLRLIILDGSKGLWSGVAQVYPQVECQLCWVHKLRNVARACPDRYHNDCVVAAAQIMYARSARTAANRFRVWKRRWQSRAPKAVACLERDFDRLLAVFAFPDSIRTIIRSTNVIERTFKEVRRRLRPMGYFQNSPSAFRIIFALFIRMNARWEQRRFHLKAIQEGLKPAA